MQTEPSRHVTSQSLVEVGGLPDGQTEGVGFVQQQLGGDLGGKRPAALDPEKIGCENNKYYHLFLYFI